MKRFKYGINCQTQNAARFYEVLPVHYLETAPGDTISGKISTKLMSDTLVKPLMNRTYHDLYSFYVPYRLVYPEWPDYISDPDITDVSALPKVTDPFYENFENNPQVKSYLAFQRRSYNLIINKFFRLPNTPEYGLDTAGLKIAPLRPTTFYKRLMDDVDISDQTIDVSGGTLTTNDLRQAFAQDRFNKTRDFYGQKYTDYLAALGVEASWSILDEPELIGMKHASLNHKTTYSTYTGDTVDPTLGQQTGDPAGTIQGQNSISLRRTFAPEHGLICTVAVVRMELGFQKNAGTPHLVKDTKDKFYSPEFETQRVSEWKQLNNSVSTPSFTTTMYDDYRVGTDLLGRPEGAPNDNYFAIGQNELNVANDYKLINPALLEGYFTGSMGDKTLVQYSQKADVRMSRLSPIRPAPAVHGVS